MVVGRIAPDEEKFSLLESVAQFSFTYGVSRGILLICLCNIHSKKPINRKYAVVYPKSKHINFQINNIDLNFRFFSPLSILTWFLTKKSFLPMVFLLNISIDSFSTDIRCI